MADQMNRWGGGTVPCIGCSTHTPTPAYVGRLKCCKERVGLCQSCKSEVEPAGFKSPAHAVATWAKEHSVHCEQSEQTVQGFADDEAEKWGPKAKELYQLLATALHAFNAETKMPHHGTETALILLCRTFCNATGVPITVFAENFLSGFEVPKPEAKPEAKPDSSLN